MLNGKAAIEKNTPGLAIYGFWKAEQVNYTLVLIAASVCEVTFLEVVVKNWFLKKKNAAG